MISPLLFLLLLSSLYYPPHHALTIESSKRIHIPTLSQLLHALSSPMIFSLLLLLLLSSLHYPPITYNFKKESPTLSQLLHALSSPMIPSLLFLLLLSSLTTSSSSSWSSRGLFHWSNTGHALHGPLILTRSNTTLSLNGFESSHIISNTAISNAWRTNSEFVVGRACYWRALKGTERRSGKLTFKRLVDQHIGGFNPIGMIRSRFYGRNDLKVYENGYFAVMAKCTFMERVVGREEQGVMGVDGITDFRVYTAAGRMHMGNTQTEDVICGRAPFGDEFQPLALLNFVKWYVARWKFHRVVVYQIGGDRSSDYDFDERAGLEISKLQAEGKLIVIDIRNELQNWFGHKAVETVLFNSNALQMFLKMDCFNRAQAQGNVRWILSPDFDEFLMESGGNANLQYSSFQDFHMQYSKQHGTNYDWYSFGSLLVKDSNLPCTCADFDIDEFMRAASGEHKQELNTGRDEPSLRPFYFIEEHGRRYWDGPRGKRKYAIKLDSISQLDSSGLGVHFLDAEYDYLFFNPARRARGLEVDPFHTLYVREYTCMHFDFPAACSVGGAVRFWAGS